MEKSGKLISCAEIVKIVSQASGIPVADIRAKSKLSEKVLARQVSVALCCQFTSMSLTWIASYLGYSDHTSALHGRKRVSECLENPEALHAMAIRDLYETSLQMVQDKIWERRNGSR